MNFEQAKNIKIEEYLKLKNINPDRSRGAGRVLIYKSPYREEKTPSMEVNTEKNVWYDHGTANGGTIIDLVMLLQNISAVETLSYLSEIYPNIKPFSFCQQKNLSQRSLNSQLKIIDVKSVTHFALIEYLRSRKITINIAERYLKEITFKTWSFTSNEYKTYWALGFKNDKGGYELRNKYFKGCSSKHITTIPGIKDDQLNIFEGFFDFLSSIALNKTGELKFDSLILNSVALKEKTLDIICKYEKINLFMDNDQAGKEAVIFFRKHHNQVRDFSETIYPAPCKDLNQYLINS